MAQRTIVWTKTADIQFVGILKYWTKRNKSDSFARKLIEVTTFLLDCTLTTSMNDPPTKNSAVSLTAELASRIDRADWEKSKPDIPTIKGI